MNYFLYFLLWTMVIYWSHRMAHVIPHLKKIHFAHHKHITNSKSPKWHWSNLFFFQDNVMSSFDVILFELVPTILFCMITGEWWILVFYYMWSAFIQENIEHNPNFNIYPLLTSGKWHLLHHKSNCNYGLLVPFWDIFFGTYKKL